MCKFFLIILLSLFTNVVWAVNYSSTDRYARKAELKSPDDLEELVTHLVKPYKTDTEKARVLLAWIVHNIDYDRYKMNAIEQNAERDNFRKKKNIPHNGIKEKRQQQRREIYELLHQQKE